MDNMDGRAIMQGLELTGGSKKRSLTEMNNKRIRNRSLTEIIKIKDVIFCQLNNMRPVNPYKIDDYTPGLTIDFTLFSKSLNN